MNKEPRSAGTAAAPAVAAQIHRCFFEPTETFIFSAVANLKRFRPAFLAWEFKNLDRFPVPRGEFFSLTSRRWTPGWFLQGAARRLSGREPLAERFLKRRQALLLHAHFGAMGVWALRLKRALKLPLITTFYGHDMSSQTLLEEFQRGYARLFREGDLFLVEGPHMRKRLAALGCPEDKIAIQRIAIPVSTLPFRLRPPKKRGEKAVISFSGRFVEKKGLLLALQALADVRASAPAFEFRIVGDGPLRSVVESFIHSHGMEDCVRLLGFLDYPRYVEQMKEADLFLHPSVTAGDGDSEGGAPTTILEAQALGLPVIATRHADIPYVVVPDHSALLSEERDVPGLARNIAQMLRDQDSWGRMGAAGRRHVEENHDVARETPRLESRYAKLTPGHGH